MRLFLSLILAATAALAQHTDILGSDYPANSLTILNAKPAVRTGVIDPTGNCKAGLDLYVRTDTFELFYCGALNVWTRAVNASGSYANPSWITSIAWAKITGAPAYQLSSEKGAANGYASLNASSLIPIGQICTGAGASGQYCDPVSRAWTNLGSGESPLTFNLPLSRSVNTISIPVATSGVNGYLSSADWVTFNAKENALTFSAIFNRTGNAIALASQSANLFLASPNGSAGAPSPRAIVSADLPATIGANTTGNAATATALAANGTNCASGEAARGVDASGNAENCFTPTPAVTIQNDGTTVGTRPTISFPLGYGLIRIIGDDPGNNRVNVGFQLDTGVTDSLYVQKNASNAMGPLGTLDMEASPADGFRPPSKPTNTATASGKVQWGTNDLCMSVGDGSNARCLAYDMDFRLTRTSAAVATINAAATSSLPAKIGIGSTVIAFTAPGTVALSGASCPTVNGTVFWYFDAAGVITAGHNNFACTFTGSGVTVATPVTGFPAGSKPIGQMTISGGAWSTSIVDLRTAWYTPPALIEGANISLARTATSVTISATGGTTVTANAPYLNIGGTNYLASVGFAVTIPPTVAGGGWVSYNSSTETFTQVGNTVVLEGTGGTAAWRARGRVIGTNRTLVAAISIQNMNQGSSWGRCAIGLHRPGGKMILPHLLSGNRDTGTSIGNQTQDDFANTNAAEIGGGQNTGSGNPSLTFFKIEITGGNVLTYYSLNGIKWTPWSSVSQTTVLGGAVANTDAFIVAADGNGTFGPTCTVLHWSES